jgi:hypothetical protein
MTKKIVECARYNSEGDCIEWKVRADGVLEAEIKQEARLCKPDLVEKIEKKVRAGSLSFKT